MFFPSVSYFCEIQELLDVTSDIMKSKKPVNTGSLIFVSNKIFVNAWLGLY